MGYSNEQSFGKYVKGYGFLSFPKKLGNKYGIRNNGYCN